MSFGRTKISTGYKPKVDKSFAGKLNNDKDGSAFSFGKDKGTRKKTMFNTSDDEDEPVPIRSSKKIVAKDDEESEDFSHEIAKVSKSSNEDNLSKILASYIETNNKMMELIKSNITNNRKLQETLENFPKQIKEIQKQNLNSLETIENGISKTTESQVEMFSKFGNAIKELIQDNTQALNEIKNDEDKNLKEAILGMDSVMNEGGGGIVILAGEKISSIDSIDNCKRFHNISDYLSGTEGDKISLAPPEDN